MFASREVEDRFYQAFREIAPMLPKGVEARLKLELKSDIGLTALNAIKPKGK